MTDEPRGAGRKAQRRTYSEAYSWAGIGVELTASVVGACLIGYWIDRHYGTDPTWLIICASLGIVGGLYNLIRKALMMSKAALSGRKDGADRTEHGDDGTG